MEVEKIHASEICPVYGRGQALGLPPSGSEQHEVLLFGGI